MASPEEIRQYCRKMHRAEQDLPKVKWAAFQEQRRREDLAAIRFQKKQGELKVKQEQPNATVVKFIGQLRKCLTRRMKESGGTEHSVIRACFLNWDADCSGELSFDEFSNAMRSLGLVVEEAVCREVVRFYDVDGDGEMKYQPLIEDVARGQRHFLHHPGPSARFEDQPLGRRAPLTPFIKLFLKKLKMKLHAQMKRAGEYERILIRRAFLNWDADASGKLNRREFMGAMRQVGIALTEDEAEKVVLFYDFDGDQEMRYQPLVDDVTAGAPHFMHHPDGSKDGAKSGGGGGGGGGDGGMAKKSGRSGRKGGGHSHSPAEDEEADPDDLLLSKMFTTRPVERQKNCVVEAFKINLRRRLEDHIRAVGGTIISILREAFLFWDCDSSGELNPDEFRGAMSRLGLHITADEASQVVKYYDREGANGRYGDNEISYQDLVEDVTKGTMHFMDHPDSSRVAPPPPMVDAPSDVKGYLRKIRDCVAKRAHADKQRNAAVRGGGQGGVAASGSSGSSLLVEPADLLHGTLLRFDKGSTGNLTRAALKRALDELRVGMTENDVGRLIWWYDQDASDTVVYKKIVKDAFGAAMSRAATTNHLAMGMGGAGMSRSLPNLEAAVGGMEGSLTSRSKRQTIMAEKGRIERRLRELQHKEGALKATPV